MNYIVVKWIFCECISSVIILAKSWSKLDVMWCNIFHFQGQSAEKRCDGQMREWDVHVTTVWGIICSPLTAHVALLPLSLSLSLSPPKYGGDISRKMKLLSRQREGKKKMKQIGNVELDRKAFLSVLERNWAWSIKEIEWESERKNGKAR